MSEQQPEPEPLEPVVPVHDPHASDTPPEHALTIDAAGTQPVVVYVAGAALVLAASTTRPHAVRAVDVDEANDLAAAGRLVGWPPPAPEPPAPEPPAA
jgi:hypothetical protein